MLDLISLNIPLVFIYSKKLRTKLAGHGDDADTDSYSDSDFDGIEHSERLSESIDEVEKIHIEHRNLELLEKR